MARARSLLPFAPFVLSMVLAAPSAAFQQIDFVREISPVLVKDKGQQRLLAEPQAAAVSGDLLVVADAAANRIVLLDRSGKVVKMWGEKGSKNGQFREPRGIAVDERGMVYVSDTGNDRIQVFSLDGAWVRTFGEEGSGPLQFDGPLGIAASRGIIYIADPGNRRVQVVSADGIFLGQLTVRKDKDEMKEPVAVSLDVQNRLVVLDAGSGAVRVFDPSGTQAEVFGMKGSGADGFDEPQGIAVDLCGNILVADTGNHRLKKFDPRGKLMASFGSEGDGPGQFRKASGVAVDRDGAVIVADAGKGTIQFFACEQKDAPLLPASPPPTVEFSKELKAQVRGMVFNKRPWGLVGDTLTAIGVNGGRAIGGSGSAPGKFRAPRGVAADGDGRFWVADTGNDRLQKFSIDGELLQVVGRSGSGEGEFDSPSGIAVGPKGTIVVADTGNRRIQVLSSKGVFLGAFGSKGDKKGQFREPVDVAVDASENIYVVDRGNERISRFDANGSLLWETGKPGAGPGELNDPENILISPDGEVYVLDAGNARVQVFAADGRLLRMFGSAGKGPGAFRSPLGLFLEQGIHLAVGDAGNGRVQVFTLRHTPAVPVGVTAQAGMNEIQLSWKGGNESYFEQFRIYRADAADGPYASVGSSAAPFFFDRSLPSNRTYFYRVSSHAREGNESALSSAVSAVTPKLVPASPRKVRVDAQEKQMTLSWLPNAEPFLKHYRIYRSRDAASGTWEPAGTTEGTLFVDSPLLDDTFYYYRLTAVGREDDESAPTDVVYARTPKASLTVPPLEIASVSLNRIFASAYKLYETEPLGTAVVRNNTDKAYPRIVVRFSIKDFMDYPTEIEVAEVPAGGQVELQLKPVFNNKILEVTENTSLQSELSLVYHVGGEPRTVTRTFPATLYERHAMTWDRKEKAGAFVTPRDPPIADFSRLTVQPYVDAYPNLPASIVYGRAIFGALGALGLTYIVDPTSPFMQFSENAAAVDYLQYPRDTLHRRSGDCDDLSVLFAACMENIGIATALVDVPEHVFVLFNTGVAEKDKASLGFGDDLLVPYQGTMWVPVEMTMVGASFTKAWQKAAEEYRTWAGRGKADIVSIQKAWERFRPVTLPSSGDRPVKISREAIEEKYQGELETLGRQRLANLSAGYLSLLKQRPEDLDAQGRLAILYAENGMHTESLEQFQKMLAVDKTNAVALNGIGNISFLQGRMEDARQAYESAAASGPADAGVLVNLARVLSRLGQAAEAKKVFEQAMAISPRAAALYPDVAAAVGMKK